MPATSGPTTPAPPTPNTPAKWGQGPKPTANWVKVRDLAKLGVHFVLARVQEGVVNKRPSYIFQTQDGQLFSANKTSRIGRDLGDYGLPPTPATYHIGVEPNPDSPTKDSLVLVAD